MSKSTKITTKKKNAKPKKEASISEEGPAEESVPVIEKDLRTITVLIESFQNVFQFYTAASVQAKCEYLGKQIGLTEKLRLIDDEIIVANQELKFVFDMNNPQEIDNLASNPVIFTVIQNIEESPESVNILSVDSTSNDTEGSSLTKESFESAISLYEALTGDIVERNVKKLEGLGKKKKGSKKSKKGSGDSKSSRNSSKEKKKKKATDKRSSKSSQKSKTKKSKESLSPKIKPIKEEPTKVIGHCLLDLFPIILGKETFSEYLYLVPPQIYHDDRMVPHTKKPGILLTVSIDKKFEFVCGSNILNLTVESIFNVPSMMNAEMDYEICISLPLYNLRKTSTIIKNAQFKESPVQDKYKYWPELPKTYLNSTKYKLNSDDLDSLIKSDIKNVNFEQILGGNNPRIEFNCLKRIFLVKEGFLSFYDQLRVFRKIVFEIYAHKKLPEKTSASSGSSKTKGKKKSKSVSSAEVSATEQKPGKTPYLHLMAIVDLSNFLYPGVTKVRIACPLTTYHTHEALVNAGLENSYFFPEPPKVVKEAGPAANKKDKKKGGDKKSKSSKSSKSSKKSKGSKKSKSSKSAAEETDLNMKNGLPLEPIPPPPPEPSVKVFNEHGEPTFIIVELEISHPLTKKKSLEDLQNELMELVNTKPTTPKNPFNNQTVKEYTERMIKEIICDINEKYAEYCNEKKLCKCSHQADFLTYLRRTGGYQNCISTLSQIASIIVRKKLNVDATVENLGKVIEDIFLYLVENVHEVLHKLTRICGNVTESKIEVDNSVLLFYAKEAVELRNLKLADRYFLERLHRNFDDPNSWFDYAVFNLEQQEQEKAFIHLKEGLSRETYHGNSLLLIALLFADKNKIQEAETCLLTVMVQEPKWVEGWTILYLFYKNTDNAGGMDLCQEMAKRYLDDPRTNDHYFWNTDDLTWMGNFFPNTVYFRAAILLLKMRMYSWVEHALSFEVRNAGLVHYLLGVVCYYRRHYEHALDHLWEARKLHGSDYPVISLTGHCYLALNKFKEARREYSYVLESYDRPEDVHLLYVNYAKIIDDQQMARKMLLVACKNHPTPYTWLSCGILYFNQSDFISAEECFSESIALDNCASEGWAYLALINLKFARIGEAELCYSLALKNNLEDSWLLQEINEGFRKLKVKMW